MIGSAERVVLTLLACVLCARGQTAVLPAPPPGGWRGVFFNPQVNADPNFPWLIYYAQHRPKIREALQDLRTATGMNLVAVFVMIPHSLKTPAQGNRVGESVEQWANTAYLDNVAAFVDDCAEAHIEVELDLVDNRWIPYRFDSEHHIGAPGKPWWPVAGEQPWREAAAWYRQVMEYVEAYAKHPTAIAYWCMMGNYTFGAAEPVLWNDDGKPEVREFTERFVKAVWPVFARTGKRPKAAPILLPIFAEGGYWQNKTPADRLAGFTNLKRWLVDELKMPPDYWVMSTYPFCDPVPDGYSYLHRIVEILGPRNARRLVSTDLKGLGHEDELRGSIIHTEGRSGADILRWHIGKCAEYRLAGWWMWAYQDTPTSRTGLRTLDGKWKSDLIDVLKPPPHAR